MVGVLRGFTGIAMLLAAGVVSAEDWLSWRGSFQNGVSLERELISSWSPEGENLLWREDFIGRSTPLVLNGRVFVQGRGGEGKLRRELVAAFDARTGEQLWEYALPTHLTTVPFNRAGWSSLAADRETGYLYAQAVAGLLVCLNQDGEVVWHRSLGEELGRFSGYGGRTHTPLVDEDRLIVNVVNSSWGELGAPRHRYYAFDKRTGDILWISTPGGNVYDRNTTSNGSIAVIGGQRLYIAGNADGRVYALNARTGASVWGFELSKRGINSSPLIDGDTVYIGHSEENIDTATLGRTVAIDATGRGDVTKTHELWRRDIKMGFPSPMMHAGRLYVVDNSSNLYALNAKTGETFWEHSLGTVGKSAPVFADGKIFATEVNGHLNILQPFADRAEVLDRDQLKMPGGRFAELYGSPAIAYGRVYFTTEEGLYCLGSSDREFEVSPTEQPPMPAERAGGDQPATLRVVPADLTLKAGEIVRFEARGFNDTGRALGMHEVEWTLDGLEAEVKKDGTVSFSNRLAAQAGHVVARLGDLEARARVRVFAELPIEEGFDDIEGRGRRHWIGAGRFQVTELEGEKVLEKPVAARGLLRSILLIGPNDLANYTVEAEVMGNQKGRRRTDVGVVNGGYILAMLGNSQKLQIRSWTAVERMAVTIPFEWEMGAWYQMKLRVESGAEKASVLAKVWKRGTPEPGSWTLTAEDPLPVTSGSPGLIGYSPASIYYDNVKVTSNS